MRKAIAWSDLELGERLGEGQSGVVYKARMRKSVAGLETGSFVAVKRYRSWVLEEPGQLQRIFREIEAGRAVTDPHLVKIHGAVLDGDGRPALVMQYCDGPTLEKILAEKGSDATLSARLRLLADVARGLSAFHEAGNIHRDIKPANVIVTSERALLTDFGVIRGSSFAEQTTTGAFLGTIRYAAPEYLFGEEYDKRIDLYSFGALVYESAFNRPIHSKHRNWARLVTVKNTVPSYDTADLNAIVDSHGWAASLFVDEVLRRTLTRHATDRTLNLLSFANAVETGLWNSRFHFSHNDITHVAEVQDAHYIFAEEAAQVLKDSWSTQEISIVIQHLRMAFWDYGIGGRRNYQNLRSDLLSYPEGRRRPYLAARHVAVRAAFAFGLLSDGEPDFRIPRSTTLPLVRRDKPSRPRRNRRSRRR